jgi:hypothetical protein
MKLPAWLARGLDAAEREVLGLVVRRQAELWTGWRPWPATVGIAVAAGLPLSRIGMSLNWGSEDALFLLCKAAALVVWSWT